MIDCLGHKNYLIKTTAADCLKYSDKNDYLVDSLIGYLNDENYDFKFTVAITLANLGESISLGILIESLSNEDLTLSQKHTAILGLCLIGDESAIPHIIRFLSANLIFKDNQIRQILNHLKFFKTRKIYPLLKAFQQIPDEKVKLQVSILLCSLNYKKGFKNLLKFIDHDDKNIKRQALSSILKYGGKTYFKIGFDHLFNEDNSINKWILNDLIKC